MRKPILVGNWKMHKSIGEALAFADAIKGPLGGITSVDLGVGAPYLTLPALSEAFKGTHFVLAGQDMFWEEKGAFTGEVSPGMLKEVANAVIIGHSERRQFFGETNETVNKKLKAALANGLLPIVCVGESLEQNQADETEAWVTSQIEGAFEGIDYEDALRVVVAYEPIWAIGTGLAATPEQANGIIRDVVRGSLAALFSTSIAQQIRIQYGGSVNTENCFELMSQSDIDGGLVGGASLKPESFISLIEQTAKAKGLA